MRRVLPIQVLLIALIGSIAAPAAAALGSLPDTSAARDSVGARAWFDVEHQRSRDADVEKLVRSSDAVVVAEFPPCSPRIRFIPVSDDAYTTERYSGPPCGSFVRVAEWLRATRVDEADSLIGVYLGSREAGLRDRWAPVQQEYDSVSSDPRRRFVAFLHLASDAAYREKMRNYRPTDAVNGFLLADESTLERVRKELARARRIEPRSGCSASLREFARLDSSDAAGVGVKLSRTTPRSWRSHLWSLVIGSGPIETSWFAPCIRPDYAYEFDFFWSETAHASPAEMRTLLDSLTTVNAVRKKRSSAADTLTLTLRREAPGGERIFECSLDWNSYRQVARILAHTIPAKAARRDLAVAQFNSWWKVRVWVNSVDWKTADEFFGKR